MCGIAGIVSCGESVSVEAESRVRAMCELQRYRGPDDIGTTVLERVCLGSVRLSILDLSQAGHMPMSDPSGRWFIAYNGEVYNFKELREELVAHGHNFCSQTDTEVVLHSFIEWGEDCLERFVGMFAFAIYDRKLDTVFLVRDRLGIKPLYYVQRAQEILFSSELKAITFQSHGLNVNGQSFIEWSLYRNVDILRPNTLLNDFSVVLPGEVVSIAGGIITRRRFYTPISYVNESVFKRYAKISAEEVVSDIQTTLDEAVEQRLVSDVPVGTLCSGGLDSSLVTAIAAAHSRDLTVFNVAIEGHKDLDESLFARQIAEHFGLKFISYPLTAQVFRQELPKVIYQSDLPLTHPNTVAYHLICQVARKEGVTVLLSGEGADELFGGYDHYRKYRTMLWLDALRQRLPRAVRQKLSVLGLACLGLQRTSMHVRELLPLTVKFIDGFGRHDWLMDCENAYEFVENSIDRALLGGVLADLGDFLTPLLRRLDRASMTNSTECRVPFLDHRLVHKAINLPLQYRVGKKGGKWVLRKIAEAYLPETITKRRKIGFPLPLQQYLSPLVNPVVFRNGFCQEQLGLSETGIRGLLEDYRENLQGFFSLLSLEIWGRMYLRNETAEEVSMLLGIADN